MTAVPWMVTSSLTVNVPDTKASFVTLNESTDVAPADIVPMVALLSMSKVNPETDESDAMVPPETSPEASTVVVVIPPSKDARLATLSVELRSVIPPTVKVPATSRELLKSAAPPTVMVRITSRDPPISTLLVTSSVFDKVVAPVTSNVLEKFTSPETSSVFPKVTAFETSSTFAHDTSPMTSNVSRNVTVSVTSNVD